MRRYIVTFGIVSAMFVGRPAAAQTPVAQTPAAGEADPGVRPTRLLDRAEVRVTRVEIQAGSTRRVHTHDDVEYHLWIPIEGQLQLTIGSEAPVAAATGQAFFLKRGTPHGFKNVGTTPGAIFEIFIKQTKTAGGQDPLGALAMDMAALREANRSQR